MTITTPLSAQSFGTGANVGNGKFPTKVTLEATTTAAQLELVITNGAVKGELRQEVKLHFAFSAIDTTAAAAVTTLRHSSRFLTVPPAEAVSGVAAKISLLEPAPGTGFLYFWLDAPNLGTAATISVNLIQYP